MPRPRLAVFKFASCDGCQLTVLDCEDELLDLVEVFDLAYFAEASSRMAPGPYDVALVDGSITTPDDAERIRAIRADSEVLVSIGACATAGGIQALRNFADVEEYLALVYAKPEYIAALQHSTPIAAHVKVDYELRGCPIDKHQLLETLTALLHGRRPTLPSHPVCVECKLAGNVCVVVAKGMPCLGPVTHTGCGALCPGYERGCYGCFGPSRAPHTSAMNRVLAHTGLDSEDRQRLYRTFNTWAPEFRHAEEEE